MSHSLFVHSTFSNARVWAFLTQVDAAEAQLCRSRGCPHCGAVLHSATSRASRTVWRLHFETMTPGGSALRRLPASCETAVVALLRAPIRVAPLFVVVNALVLAGGARLEPIAVGSGGSRC